MDPELQKVEKALAAHTPARVPEALEARVFEILDGGPHTGSGTLIRFPLLRYIGAAAAVLIAATGVFFSVLNSLPKDTTGSGRVAGDATPRRAFIPVRAENVFEGASDEGLTLTEDNRPVQKLRYRFSDTYRWENPEDGSTIEMVVPRERLLLVPARTD